MLQKLMLQKLMLQKLMLLSRYLQSIEDIKSRFTLEQSGCNRDNTLELLLALQKRKNIFFEMKGDSEIDWLLSNIRSLEYEIHVVYVGANETTVRERIIQRAQQQLDNLGSSPYGKGVRFPYTEFSTTARGILDNVPRVEIYGDQLSYYDTSNDKSNNISREVYRALLRDT